MQKMILSAIAMTFLAGVAFTNFPMSVAKADGVKIVVGDNDHRDHHRHHWRHHRHDHDHDRDHDRDRY